MQIGHGGATQEELLWDGLYVVVGAEAPLPVPDVKTKASKVCVHVCCVYWVEDVVCWVGLLCVLGGLVVCMGGLVMCWVYCV